MVRKSRGGKGRKAGVRLEEEEGKVATYDLPSLAHGGAGKEVG